MGEKSKNRHKPYTVFGHLLPVGALTYHLIVGQAFQPAGEHLVSQPRTEIEYLRKSAASFEHGKQLDTGQRNAGIKQAMPISIDSNVWRAANVVVLPGVTIGDGAVVGAGSVMTLDVLHSLSWPAIRPDSSALSAGKIKPVASDRHITCHRHSSVV